MNTLIIIVVLIALISTGGYFVHRRHAHKIASMTPEERELREAEKEHNVSVKQAEAELRKAEKEHNAFVKQRDKELRSVTKEYERRVKEAELALKDAEEQGHHTLGSYRGKNGIVKLWEDHVSTPEGDTYFKDGSVEATVDTAGNLAVTKRATLTRVIALGGIGGLLFKKTERHDTREVYLLIESPNFASLVQCNPDDGPNVRQFATQINNASRAHKRLFAVREQAVAQATRQLETARDDRMGIETAEKELNAAKDDRTDVETAQKKLGVVTSDTKRLDTARQTLSLPPAEPTQDQSNAQTGG